MKNKKIILALAIVSPLTLMTSCAKEVTLDEAKEHVSKYYSQSTVDETFSSGTYTATTYTKGTGVFEDYAQDKETTTSDLESLTVIGEDDLEIEDSDYYTVKYEIDGKKLKVTLTLTKSYFEDYFSSTTLSELEVDGSGYMVETINEYGLAASSESKMTMNVSYSSGGVNFEGTMETYEKCEYSYTKK